MEVWGKGAAGYPWKNKISLDLRMQNDDNWWVLKEEHKKWGSDIMPYN